MATTKAKPPATDAGSAATTGAASGAVAQPDSGVNDGIKTPAFDRTEPVSPGGGAADAGLAPCGEGLPLARNDGAALSAGAVATPGATAAIGPVGSDDVQTSATSDSGGSASSSFALPPMSEALEQLRSLHPEDLARARASNQLMSTALAALDQEHHIELGEAVAAAESAGRPGSRLRGLVLFSGGGVPFPIGDLVEGNFEQLQSLAISGDVDLHTGAVKAAEARGVKIHHLGA